MTKKNSNSIEARIFLVGCPRSGTTLLQSLLAAHPKITSFPESKFFWSLLKDRGFLRRTLDVPSRSFDKEAFKKCLERIDSNSKFQFNQLNSHLFAYQYAIDFVKVLDEITLKQGKTIWIEKTPKHLLYINQLQRWIKNAYFIHIIRDGSDVVASLYEVTHEHSQVWNGAKSIDDCIQRWVSDVKLSLSYYKKPRHHLVLYKNLIDDSQSQMKKICQFLQIDFENDMLENYSKYAKEVSLPYETWKTSVGDPIQSRHHHKFKKLFDSEQQNYILSKISEGVDLSEIFDRPT